MNKERITDLVKKQTRLSEGARETICATGGAIFAIFLSTFLHFAFEKSGNFLPAAIFASVNESVWEHVKILAWGYIFWTLPATMLVRAGKKRFITARTAGLYVLMLGVIFSFYVYSGILGKNILLIDIIISVFWLYAAERVSISIIKSKRKVGELYPVALAGAALALVMLLCFTVSAPKIGLFRDPLTGGYGVGRFARQLSAFVFRNLNLHFGNSLVK